ncbi:Coiled-coil domain-containing protein 96 [Eufriesea mexicana]|uniref:Coiled-coil domain-containing protein 96 n=1 Tax=Eufriesea mexicana TaxID=516756 RepID=A0A310SL72_9HYME|nr:Coiled-coil domain-containing protein 96 [Eufriesea mexicana]
MQGPIGATLGTLSASDRAKPENGEWYHVDPHWPSPSDDPVPLTKSKWFNSSGDAAGQAMAKNNSRVAEVGKNGDSSTVHEAGNGSSGGGLGKWLREHLGGGSKGGQDGGVVATKANSGVAVEGSGNEKPFGKTVYASQNLYCSLPRDHGRHAYNGGRKAGHGNSAKLQGHDRQRCASVNHHEKITFGDLGTLTRGGPIYGSEGKTLKKRNRDRRRHSLNEIHEQGRQRRATLVIPADSCNLLESRSPDFSIPDPRFPPPGIMTTSGNDQRFSLDIVRLHGDVEIPRYKFDVTFPMEEIDELEDYFGEEMAEAAEEGTEEVEASGTKETDEFPWDAITVRSDEDEKYEDEYREKKEVGEEEEEEVSLSTTVSTVEKPEEEAPRPEESDHVLAEIPAEDLADREEIVGKLREMLSEKSELRRKNRMLELWVSRHLKKTQQRLTPSDPTKTMEQMEEKYREVLREYKTQVAEILSEQAEMTYDLQTYAQKVQSLEEEDDRIFEGYLNRQKETAVGLIFSKTGRKITEKLMDNLIRRQTARREILARDRHSYVLLQHRLDELNMRLKIAETLGEGMTTMDYEALYIANVNHKDRLDDRDRELEKLRIKYSDMPTFRVTSRSQETHPQLGYTLDKTPFLSWSIRIAETVNAVAQYKEKEECILEDIELEQKQLDEFREANTKVREHLNRAHVALNDVRETLNEKRLSAGLLVAQQELIEMQKVMKLETELKNKIQLIKREIELYEPAKRKMKKKASRTTFA